MPTEPLTKQKTGAGKHTHIPPFGTRQPGPQWCDRHLRPKNAANCFRQKIESRKKISYSGVCANQNKPTQRPCVCEATFWGCRNESLCRDERERESNIMAPTKTQPLWRRAPQSHVSNDDEHCSAAHVFFATPRPCCFGGPHTGNA